MISANRLSIDVLIVAMLCGTFAWTVDQCLRRYDATISEQACENMTDVATRAARIGVGIGADAHKRQR